MSYIVSELFCQLVTSCWKLWVVETAGGLFHSLTFAAAVSVETLLGKKGPAVESELSHLELVRMTLVGKK